MQPLSSTYLAKTHRELDEVAVAISVVGTRRKRLMDLARMTVPVQDALVGERSEVKKARDDLVRLAHNVRRSSLKPLPASRSVKALAAQLKVVQKLVRRKLGDVPRLVTVGPSSRGASLVNGWGYTESEMSSFVRALDGAMKDADRIGLELPIGTVVLVGKGPVLSYDLFLDQFVANPSEGRGRDVGIANALASKLWLSRFSSRDVRVWEDAGSPLKAFSKSFFRLLRGKVLEEEDAQRMEATVGRIIGAEKWSKVA